MTLSDANKKAKKLIERMAQANISNSLPGEEREVLYLIRDGIGDTPLDSKKLEEYDDCYDVDLSR